MVVNIKKYRYVKNNILIFNYYIYVQKYSKNKSHMIRSNWNNQITNISYTNISFTNVK